jgi:hypothetical protein
MRIRVVEVELNALQLRKKQKLWASATGNTAVHGTRHWHYLSIVITG